MNGKIEFQELNEISEREEEGRSMYSTTGSPALLVEPYHSSHLYINPPSRKYSSMPYERGKPQYKKTKEEKIKSSFSNHQLPPKL